MEVCLQRRFFKLSVDAVFKNWTALQMLVSHSAAGRDSAAVAEWLCEATAQWFADNANLAVSEVSDYLEEIVVREFNVEIQDGSYEEVSGTLCRLFEVCSTKDEKEVLDTLGRLPKCDLSGCQAALDEEGEDDGDDSAEEAMEVDAGGASNGGRRRQPPQTDEDGWTTVPSRRTTHQ